MTSTHTVKATDHGITKVCVFQANRAEITRLFPVELKVLLP